MFAQSLPLPRVLPGVRVLLLALVAVLAPLGLAAEEAAAEGSGPDEVVRTVSDDILGIIATYAERFEADPNGYYTAVDDTMSGFVDYPAIARAVMARYWADASEEQRTRFVDTFRRGLVRTYARALLEFEQERVNVLPLREDHLRGDRALVRMEITGSNGRVYPLQYSMGRGDDGVWRVRNVIVDGVNLGLTYRNQFASAMQTGEARGNIDAVIDSWTLDAPSGSGG